MCGIVGIVGVKPVTQRLLESLRRLEYRGYDSAGIAVISKDAKITRCRAQGKLANLEQAVKDNQGSLLQEGHAGIGHTRWATHGAPTEENAHPHQSKKVAVVHNGIIENFQALRYELEAKQHVFTSQTDTETIAHLCMEFLDKGVTPLEAARATLSRLEGAFALCLIFENHNNLMIVARRGSPLALGYGDNEMYVGSDALALSPLTNRICYLEEGDYAVLSSTDAQIYSADHIVVQRPVKVIPNSSIMVEKGEYRHFMAKEIHEQPNVVGYTLSHYIDIDTRIKVSENVDFSQFSGLSVVACGTASFAGHVAKYWFEDLARLRVENDIASEFRYREPPLATDSASLFVSQSGETADTLAALRYCKEQKARIISVVNVTESSIARESDVVLQTLAGPEIGVASTKAFTCQLTVLACLSLLAARQRNYIDAEQEQFYINRLQEVPRLMAQTLQQIESSIDNIAQELSKARDVLYLGRGTMFPIALEGALKLKEISYIHAEGYAAGELKHGPIALIDEAVPVVVLAPSTDPLFDKTISNMHEVVARGGKVLLISDEEGIQKAGHADQLWQIITIPKVHAFVAPLIYSIPVQLLAYYTAYAKGTDVDQPRNLAKSVTVE